MFKTLKYNSNLYLYASIIFFQDGRLHSGDHIIQIGDVDVRGFGSEQVAQVLRQAGSHVRLIVARPITDPANAHMPTPGAPIVPTMNLDEHLEEMISALEKQDQMLIMKQEQLEQGMLDKGVLAHAQVHEVMQQNIFERNKFSSIEILKRKVQ